MPDTPASVPATAQPPHVKQRHLPTTQLIENETRKRKLQFSGRKFVSRPLDQRQKEQNESLVSIANKIHHGTKKDFLAGLANSVSNAKDNLLESEWDGTLTAQDIIDLAKNAQSPKREKSVYDMIASEIASTTHHVSVLDILKLQDSQGQRDMFRNLRKLLPGFFDSERQTDKLRSAWHKEFEVVLEPKRTTTGWSVNPNRLHKCLSFLYPWLDDVDQEWWRLYGDARNYGGQKSVLIAISNINNELMFNGNTFQSPEEC